MFVEHIDPCQQVLHSIICFEDYFNRNHWSKLDVALLEIMCMPNDQRKL